MIRPGQQCSLNSPKSWQIMAMGRQVAAFLLASSIVTLSLGGESLAQVLDSTARPVRGQIAISRDVAITPSKDKVSLNLRDADVQDVLQMLAKQGKFNLILDSSVSGSLTVDISNVSINKALEYIFTMMDLSYVKDGATVIVAKKATIDSKNMAVRTLKAIPVQYKSAVNIANELNGTIFKVPRAGGSATALAAADPDSNSLLIMGTETDIKLVGDALRELDVPRNRKVYHIRHNLPADVANVLAANFFRNNPGITINNSGGGASSASTTTASSNSSGSSSSSSGSSSSGGSSSSSSGSSSSGGSSSSSSGSSSSGSGTSSNPVLGVSVTSFTSDGVTFISEPVSSTLTVLGTEEQIALIDSVIDQVDVQRAQVAIEVALVEITNSDKKTLKPTMPTLKAGTGLISLSPLAGGAANTFVISNPFSQRGISFPTSVGGINQASIIQTNVNIRNKVLANPTMVTIDGQAVSINISDTVASVVYTSTITNGVAQLTPTVNQQQAGVTVSLTPKIYNDGSIVMTALTPTVTQPSGLLPVPAAGNVPPTSIPLLSTRSMSLAGVRVKDGETLVIGGLLKESNQLNVNKVPGLDKLPILGAMFRAINQNDKDKTELVLMVTPHLLKEDNVAYFNNANSGKFSNMNYGRGGIVPVAMPKFTGSVSPELMQSIPGAAPAASPVPQPESAPAPTSGHLFHRHHQTAEIPTTKPAVSSLDSKGMIHISQPPTTEQATKSPEATIQTVAGQPNPMAGVTQTESANTTGKSAEAISAQLQSPRIEIQATPEQSVSALMANNAKKSTSVPTSNEPNRTTVYRNPNASNTSTPPSLNPLGLLDEILK